MRFFRQCLSAILILSSLTLAGIGFADGDYCQSPMVTTYQPYLTTDEHHSWFDWRSRHWAPTRLWIRNLVSYVRGEPQLLTGHEIDAEYDHMGTSFNSEVLFAVQPCWGQEE